MRQKELINETVLSKNKIQVYISLDINLFNTTKD